MGLSCSFVAVGHSTNTAALRCISRYVGQVDGVGMNSNTRQRRFLCRKLMSIRFERGNSSEIPLEMDSHRLQRLEKSLGAQSAVSIPASTEEEDGLSGVYIYLS